MEQSRGRDVLALVGETLVGLPLHHWLPVVNCGLSGHFRLSQCTSELGDDRFSLLQVLVTSSSSSPSCENTLLGASGALALLLHKYKGTHQARVYLFFAPSPRFSPANTVNVLSLLQMAPSSDMCRRTRLLPSCVIVCSPLYSPSVIPQSS